MAVQCPICSARVTGRETVCEKCNAELGEYLAVVYAPDVLFNEAAELAASGELRSAYDKLAAAHYLRPHDMEILVEMSRLAEALGDLQNAMEKMAVALVSGGGEELKKDYSRLATLLNEEQMREKEKRELTGLLYSDIRAIAARAIDEALSQALEPDENEEEAAIAEG